MSSGNTVVPVQEALAAVRKVPEWTALRLASVTGTRPGLWVVSALAALVGAVVAVLVVFLVYVSVERSTALWVPSEASDG